MYQDTVIFQAKDVNHKVDGSGWTTTIAGVMRTTLDAVFKSDKNYQKFKNDYFNNYRGKLEQSLKLEEKRRGEQLDKEADLEYKRRTGIAGSKVGAGIEKQLARFGNFISNLFYKPKIKSDVD